MPRSLMRPSIPLQRYANYIALNASICENDVLRCENDVLVKAHFQGLVIDFEIVVDSNL